MDHTTINQIKQYHPRGYYQFDRKMLSAASRIARDPKMAMEDRIEAVRQIDRIMGLEPSEVTERDVIELVKEGEGFVE